jgi:hypothetical protein
MESAGQLRKFNVRAQRLEFAESITATAFPSAIQLGSYDQELIMSNTSTAQKARQERRLRPPGFLRSLGVERTTAFLIAAVAGLLFTFVTILTSEGPATPDADSAAQTESIFDAAEMVDSSQ